MFHQKEKSMSALKKLSAAVALAFAASGAHAQVSGGAIKIGVLNDMSSLYADIGGPGSVTAARMAVEDFGAAKKGMKVEIVSADHQNKPDVGSQIARQW
jgi:branched-chain amino acid transport system substrate-binding protein